MIMAIVFLTVTLSPIFSLDADGQTVSSRKHPYELAPPKSWKPRHTPGGEVDLALLSPRTQQGANQDAFVENLTVIVKPKTPELDARRAANNGVSSLRRRLRAFRIVEQGPFRTESGADAYRIVYEGTLDKQPVRNTAYAVAGESIVLTITGSALAATHADYTDTFDRCVASIKIKDRKPEASAESSRAGQP